MSYNNLFFFFLLRASDSDGARYLMLRRYADATSCFSSILLFLARAKQQTREQHSKVPLFLFILFC